MEAKYYVTKVLTTVKDGQGRSVGFREFTLPGKVTKADAIAALEAGELPPLPSGTNEHIDKVMMLKRLYASESAREWAKMLMELNGERSGLTGGIGYPPVQDEPEVYGDPSRISKKNNKEDK